MSNKYLGLVFQSDFKWVSHYNKISAKAYQKLGLLKRTFSSSNSVETKKQLYISLVKSQLLYGSLLWRPMLIKDILSLEKIQRRATKFILGQGLSLLTYKERLVKLNLLPLMYHLELADIMFYVNSYKNRSPRFNISDYVTPTTGYTRSSVNHSLNHTYSRTNNLRHFYYNRLPRLWNSLPPMDMNLTSSTIKATLKNLLWQHFLCNFDSDAPCTFHFKCPCNKCSNMHI